MKKNIKKITAFTLAAVMLATTILPAFADDDIPVNSEPAPIVDAPDNITNQDSPLDGFVVNKNDDEDNDIVNNIPNGNPQTPEELENAMNGVDKDLEFKGVEDEELEEEKEKEENEDGIARYTVTFVDGLTSETISTQVVAEGENAVEPFPPVHAGYNFLGWNGTYTGVTSDSTVIAEYEADEDAEYEVTFIDSFDDTVLSTQTVKAGESAVEPEVPSHEGYTFLRWTGDFTEISCDRTLYTVYELENELEVVECETIEDFQYELSEADEHRVIITSTEEISFKLASIKKVIHFADMYVMTFEKEEDAYGAYAEYSFEYLAELDNVISSSAEDDEVVVDGSDETEEIFETATSDEETVVIAADEKTVTHTYSDADVPELNDEIAEGHFTIAIIDTGISGNSDVLNGKVLDGINTIDSTIKDGYLDDNGHGTIIANEILSYLKEVDEDAYDKVAILPIKAMDATGNGKALNTYLAIKYAIECKVDVINISLTGLGNSMMLQNAINEAHNAGITVVVAAGNNSDDIAMYSPANIHSAITVTATDSNKEFAAYSNFGDGVDFASNGEYTYQDVTVNGTSFAAANVSALISRAKLKLEEIEAKTEANAYQTLVLNAEDLGEEGYDVYYGYGYVDYKTALDNLETEATDEMLTINYDVDYEEPDIDLTTSGYDRAFTEYVVRNEAEFLNAINTIQAYSAGRTFYGRIILDNDIVLHQTVNLYRGYVELYLKEHTLGISVSGNGFNLTPNGPDAVGTWLDIYDTISGDAGGTIVYGGTNTVFNVVGTDIKVPNEGVYTAPIYGNANPVGINFHSGTIYCPRQYTSDAAPATLRAFNIKGYNAIWRGYGGKVKGNFFAGLWAFNTAACYSLATDFEDCYVGYRQEGACVRFSGVTEYWSDSEAGFRNCNYRRGVFGGTYTRCRFAGVWYTECGTSNEANMFMSANIEGQGFTQHGYIVGGYTNSNMSYASTYNHITGFTQNGIYVLGHGIVALGKNCYVMGMTSLLDLTNVAGSLEMWNQYLKNQEAGIPDGSTICALTCVYNAGTFLSWSSDTFCFALIGIENHGDCILNAPTIAYCSFGVWNEDYSNHYGTNATVCQRGGVIKNCGTASIMQGGYYFIGDMLYDAYGTKVTDDIQTFRIGSTANDKVIVHNAAVGGGAALTEDLLFPYSNGRTPKNNSVILTLQGQNALGINSTASEYIQMDFTDCDMFDNRDNAEEAYVGRKMVEFASASKATALERKFRIVNEGNNTPMFDDKKNKFSGKGGSGRIRAGVWENQDGVNDIGDNFLYYTAKFAVDYKMQIPKELQKTVSYKITVNGKDYDEYSDGGYWQEKCVYNSELRCPNCNDADSIVKDSHVDVKVFYTDKHGNVAQTDMFKIAGWTEDEDWINKTPVEYKGAGTKYDAKTEFLYYPVDFAFEEILKKNKTMFAYWTASDNAEVWYIPNRDANEQQEPVVKENLNEKTDEDGKYTFIDMPEDITKQRTESLYDRNKHDYISHTYDYVFVGWYDYTDEQIQEENGDFELIVTYKDKLHPANSQVVTKDWYYEKIAAGEVNIIKNGDETETIAIPMYGTWDESPVVTAIDAYVKPSQVDAGFDEDYVLSIIEAAETDREDDYNDNEAGKEIHLRDDIEVIKNEIKKVGGTGAVSVTIYGTDSRHPLSKPVEYTVMLYVTYDDKLDARSFVRFIDRENYEKAAEDDGALMDTSVWYVIDETKAVNTKGEYNPAQDYVKAITDAFDRIDAIKSGGSRKAVFTATFDINGIKKSQEFVKPRSEGGHGRGNLEANESEKFPLSIWLDEFEDCITNNLAEEQAENTQIYTVNFNANVPRYCSSVIDGTMPSIDIKRKEYISANAYTLEGYTFGGWATSQRNVNGVRFAKDGQPIKLESIIKTSNRPSVNLYAIWLPNEYVVHYNPNGAKVTEPMADKKMTYDNVTRTEKGLYTQKSEYLDTVKGHYEGHQVRITFDANTGILEKDSDVLDGKDYKDVNIEFDGWAKEETGAVMYEDEAEVKNLTNVQGDTVNLYAVWSAGIIKLPNATKEDYTFDGWWTTKDDSGELIGFDEASYNATAESETLYAHWRKNKYTIKYDENLLPTMSQAPSGSIESTEHKADEPKALTTATYSCPGYVFKGWSRTAGNNTVEYTPGEVVVNLKRIETDPATGNTEEKEIEDGTELILYAVWEAGDYTVSYDGNAPEGATVSGVPASDTVKSGEYYTVSSQVPTCVDENGEDMVFIGWTTEPEGGNSVIRPNQQVLNLIDMDGNGQTLYAQWKTASKVARSFDIDDAKNDDKGLNLYFKAQENAVRYSITRTSEKEEEIKVSAGSNLEDITLPNGPDAGGTTVGTAPNEEEVETIMIKPTVMFDLSAEEATVYETVTLDDGTEVDVLKFTDDTAEEYEKYTYQITAYDEWGEAVAVSDGYKARRVTPAKFAAVLDTEIVIPETPAPGVETDIAERQQLDYTITPEEYAEEPEGENITRTITYKAEVLNSSGEVIQTIDNLTGEASIRIVNIVYKNGTTVNSTCKVVVETKDGVSSTINSSNIRLVATTTVTDDDSDFDTTETITYKPFN